MASSGTYFGTPALYGVMKKVELPEHDTRDVEMKEVGRFGSSFLQLCRHFLWLSPTLQLIIIKKISSGST